MVVKQLSIFLENDLVVMDENDIKMGETVKKSLSPISERLIDEFAIMQIPFLGCDFDLTYSKIVDILPKEDVNFFEFGLETNIACELICAAICHQINWDFLRRSIYKATKENKDWTTYKNLCGMKEQDIARLLQGYSKVERIRAKERADLLCEVGKMIANFGSFQNLFLDKDMQLLPYEKIKENLLNCSTFSRDPEEKKLQLAFQKLSNIKELEGLSKYYKPAIDYHLIRCYLRRGLIYPKTKYAESFIYDITTQRKETTVGAMRKLCCQIIQQIAGFTLLDIGTINLVEWHLGRSVCIQGKPDCLLETKEAKWLKKAFSKCPFFESCVAQCYKKEYLQIQEPCYDGTSY